MKWLALALAVLVAGLMLEGYTFTDAVAAVAAGGAVLVMLPVLLLALLIAMIRG